MSQLLTRPCAFNCLFVGVDQNKGCKVQTVSDYINHMDCQSDRKMDLTFCSGDCNSFSRWVGFCYETYISSSLTEIDSHKWPIWNALHVFFSFIHRYTAPGLSSCSCCQATRSSNRTVYLGCVNGDIVTYSYIHVEECSCGKTSCHVNDALIENNQRKRSLGLPWAAVVNHQTQAKTKCLSNILVKICDRKLI